MARARAVNPVGAKPLRHFDWSDSEVEKSLSFFQLLFF